MNHPKTYSELLALLPAASIVDWKREARTLNVFFDDVAGDRRTVLDVRTSRDRASVRVLAGYDRAKRSWREHLPCPDDIEFTSKRGLKAVLAWIRAEAVKQCEWQPNPASLSIYAQEAA